jgi:Bacterial Ig-like domain (group 2)
MRQYPRLSVLLIVGLVACGENGPAPGGPTPPAVRVTVLPARALLPPGSTIRLDASVTTEDGKLLTDRSVVWRTSDARVAPVDATGLVTAVGPGAATITAIVEEQRSTAFIDVGGAPTSITLLMQEPGLLVLGYVAHWTAVVRDADDRELTYAEVTWASSNPAVARVDPSGRVTGLSEGSAEISASSGSASASAGLTVVPPSDPTGDWTMEEVLTDLYDSVTCLAGGEASIRLKEDGVALTGAYHRIGACSFYSGAEFDMSGPVTLAGRLDSPGTTLTSEGLPSCSYFGTRSGGSGDRVEGEMSCSAAEGLPIGGLYGRFTLTRR